MPWGTFYNIYGKKYGLYQLKQAPDASNIIRVGADNFSQVVGELNMPKKIVLNVIKGNWALVSVVDLDKYHQKLAHLYAQTGEVGYSFALETTQTYVYDFSLINETNMKKIFFADNSVYKLIFKK